MKKTNVISKDVALEEVETLINRFVKKPVPAYEIEETYPDILDAIMDGFLTFNEKGVPVYKLKDVINNESGSVFLEEINFTTRILPTELREMAKGIDLKKDPLGLQIKMIAHITDQADKTIDKYSRYDYDVISQICTIFS